MSATSVLESRAGQPSAPLSHDRCARRQFRRHSFDRSRIERSAMPAATCGRGQRVELSYNAALDIGRQRPYLFRLADWHLAARSHRGAFCLQATGAVSLTPASTGTGRCAGPRAPTIRMPAKRRGKIMRRRKPPVISSLITSKASPRRKTSASMNGPRTTRATTSAAPCSRSRPRRTSVRFYVEFEEYLGGYNFRRRQLPARFPEHAARLGVRVRLVRRPPPPAERTAS